MAQLPDASSVVIIGAGPTGLTAANLLAAYGIDVVVLERAGAPLNLPRAIVIDDEGARTLQVFGLHRSYVEGTVAAVGSRYYSDSGQCFAETGAGIETYGFPKRSYIFQPDLEHALRERLNEQAPGSLYFGAEVVGIENAAAKALLAVQTATGLRHITADWVLACDGGRSPTRERLGIAMSGNTYGQDWIVVDTRDDPDRELLSKFFCSNERPHVSVPAPHWGRRYEFMMLPGETREEVLSPGYITRLMKPFRDIREDDIIRKTVYTFHARIADRFRDHRVLLLGDAAHLTPPFAGQGMNAGLRDAHNVTWKIASVVAGGADPVLLDTYDAERRAPAWDMIQLAVAMGEIVMPLDPLQLEFRRLLLKALEPFPKVKDYLIQMRFKPRPRYAQGAFLGLDAPEFDADLTGEMIPQPRVQGPAGAVRLDDMLGPGFGLIVQDAPCAAALAAAPAGDYAGLPMSRVALSFGGDHKFNGIRISSEADSKIARPLRTHRDKIMLIRPDRYCAATFEPDGLADGLERYARLLGMKGAVETRAKVAS